MASKVGESKDGGGDGYTSPVSSLGFLASVESGELSPPAVSVTSPVESSSSSLIPEQIVDASTDSLDTESFPVESEGSDGGGNAVKKAVWSKPLNAVEVLSPVMGAVSWPALGESTKVAAKSSSSLQAVGDGSLLPALQVTGNLSPSSHKPASVDTTSTPNQVTNSGQWTMKRDGGNSGANLSSNRGVSQPENQELQVESQSNSYGKPAYKESPRGGFGSQPSSGNDHYYQRNSYRRGSAGLHPRGGGSYQHNYGGKLDQGQGRGNQEWNQNRNFNGDANMQSQRGGFRRGGYIRPPVHNSTPCIPPPMHLPVRPFGNSVLYPDVASSMIYFQGPPVGGPFYFPGPDPLHDKIVNQINYYFSNDNLVKDTYLRRYMDEQGWVPVSLIARFNKVSSLTDNVQLILDVMQKSTVVEVQGDKIRRRNDWMKWLMPPAVEDLLESQLQGIRLEEGFSSRSSSVELCSQLQQGGSARAQMA